MNLLTSAQIKLIMFYSVRAKVDYAEVIKWVEEWKTTIQEIKQGILWIKVN